MSRILISLVITAVLASPVLAQSLDPVDDSGSGRSTFDQVDNNLQPIVDDGKGVALSAPINNYGARADREGAAANNGSSAYVDNSVFMKDSALSRTDLKGEISGNAVHMEDSHFDGVNKIDDGAFKDSKGVSQTSQNSGQNSLIQQSFTIESNVKVDHRRP
jgi:hypothetical protein